MKTVIAIVLGIITVCAVACTYYNKGFNEGVTQTEKCMDGWGKMKAYEDGFVCLY